MNGRVHFEADLREEVRVDARITSDIVAEDRTSKLA